MVVTGPPDDAARGLTREADRPEDLALLVPRIALFPVHAALVTTFAPLRLGIRFAARHHLPQRVERLIYWDRAKTYGVAPSVGLQAGLSPMVGARFFHNDVLGNQERFTLSGAVGGSDLFNVGARFAGDRVAGSRVWTQVGVEYERAPNLFFQGVGLDGDRGQSRYTQRRILGLLGGGVTVGPDDLLQLGVTGIFNRRNYDGKGLQRQSDPSIEELYDTDQLVGFDDGAITLETDFIVRLDARQSEGIRPIGPRAELFGGPIFNNLGQPFFHYGLEAAVTGNLYRGDRLLTFRTFLEAVEGPEEVIPFTSLPRLGGANRLRGYRQGRFRDRRAAVATVEYSYPVHQNLQSVVFLDVGTVGSTWADVVEPANWQPGGGVGLLIGSRDSVVFRAELAYGEGLIGTLATSVPLAFNNRGDEL